MRAQKRNVLPRPSWVDKAPSPGVLLSSPVQGGTTPDTVASWSDSFASWSDSSRVADTPICHRLLTASEQRGAAARGGPMSTRSAWTSESDRQLDGLKRDDSARASWARGPGRRPGRASVAGAPGRVSAMPQISVIVPAYNEAERLASLAAPPARQRLPAPGARSGADRRRRRQRRRHRAVASRHLPGRRAGAGAAAALARRQGSRGSAGSVGRPRRGDHVHGRRSGHRTSPSSPRPSTCSRTTDVVVGSRSDARRSGPGPLDAR